MMYSAVWSAHVCPLPAMEADEPTAGARPLPGITICGSLMLISGGTQFLASHYKEPSKDDLFIYDCSTAIKNPPKNKGFTMHKWKEDTLSRNRLYICNGFMGATRMTNNGILGMSTQKEDEKSAGKGSDNILACAFSSSGTYFALTNDSKHLILFQSKPSWKCLSVRSVVRRCTSLIITAAEDKILIADKSGDVYSYSITEPESTGRIELGHLSLLLDVALSPDDQYIVTADRDEKIRVSLTRAPHNIVSFCLGHKEFVSRIFVISNYPDLLLSASGDSTVRLWEYKNGKEVDCCHLESVHPYEATNTNKKYTVARTVYCCKGNYVAILYDCIPTVTIFQLDTGAQKLVYKQHISLNHKGWGIAFEETGGLWILQEDKQTPLLFYQPVDGQWQSATEEKELLKMSKYLHDNWQMFEGCFGKESCYQNLYKASFDNMTAYLQKKEERLQQQKNKRQKADNESNGQTKKIKAGASSL